MNVESKDVKNLYDEDAYSYSLNLYVSYADGEGLMLFLHREANVGGLFPIPQIIIPDYDPPHAKVLLPPANCLITCK